MKGRSLLHQKSNLTITTEASITSYRGYLNNYNFREFDPYQKMHINWLELAAVFSTLKHVVNKLTEQLVLSRCDNFTVV